VKEEIYQEVLNLGNDDVIDFQNILRETLKETNLFFDSEENMIWDKYFKLVNGNMGKYFKVSNYQFNRYPNKTKQLSSFHNSIFNTILRKKLDMRE